MNKIEAKIEIREKNIKDRVRARENEFLHQFLFKIDYTKEIY